MWCRQRLVACGYPNNYRSSCRSRRAGAKKSASQVSQRAAKECTESSIQGDTVVHFHPARSYHRLSAAPELVIGWQQARAEQELKKVLTADDAPAALRLVLHDAATYDVDSGVGGLNGSIVLKWVGCHSGAVAHGSHVSYVACGLTHGHRRLLVCHSEELNRPQNKDLSDIVRKLESAKGAIDATSAAASMSGMPPLVLHYQHSHA